MTVCVDHPAEGIALVSLNRPEALNAFNRQMRDDLRDALAGVCGDSAVRAIVLTGTGRGFSAGADIRDMSGHNVEDELNSSYGAMLSIIQGGETPVIAAINGPAAGIGMTLALTCDLKVMDENAYLMSAFANIGLVPDGGLSWLLTQQIGYSRAFQLAIEAEKLGAEEAHALGLVNHVAPSGTVVNAALDWAATIADRAPRAVGLTKRAFRASFDHGLKNAMAYEAMLQRTAIATDDCREGVSALMEKRPPQFKGR